MGGMHVVQGVNGLVALQEHHRANDRCRRHAGSRALRHKGHPVKRNPRQFDPNLIRRQRLARRQCSRRSDVNIDFRATKAERGMLENELYGCSAISNHRHTVAIEITKHRNTGGWPLSLDYWAHSGRSSWLTRSTWLALNPCASKSYRISHVALRINIYQGGERGHGDVLPNREHLYHFRARRIHAFLSDRPHK